MRQNTVTTPATLDDHQYAWPDYKSRLQRALRELMTMQNNATTDTERNRLITKSQALVDVVHRWNDANTTVTPNTTADQYAALWGAFAQETFNAWVPAHEQGDTGSVYHAAYATGLGLASDLQRGYAYDIDSPPYISDWFAIHTPN